APSSFATASAVRLGTWSAKMAEPYVVVRPAVSKRSLTARGMPPVGSGSGRARKTPGGGCEGVVTISRRSRFPYARSSSIRSQWGGGWWPRLLGSSVEVGGPGGVVQVLEHPVEAGRADAPRQLRQLVWR